MLDIKIKKINAKIAKKNYIPNKIIRRRSEAKLNYDNIVVASDMDTDRPLWGGQ